MPARCTAAALLALSASLQPPDPRRTHLKKHAAIDDEALLDAYRAEIAPDAADAWWREFVAATERPPRPGAHGISSQAVEARSACLLYTSPSPRDMRRSRMPSSA